jgi:hypothetical protein
MYKIQSTEESIKNLIGCHLDGQSSTLGVTTVLGQVFSWLLAFLLSFPFFPFEENLFGWQLQVTVQVAVLELSVHIKGGLHLINIKIFTTVSPKLRILRAKTVVWMEMEATLIRTVSTI